MSIKFFKIETINLIDFIKTIIKEEKITHVYFESVNDCKLTPIDKWTINKDFHNIRFFGPDYQCQIKNNKMEAHCIVLNKNASNNDLKILQSKKVFVDILKEVSTLKIDYYCHPVHGEFEHWKEVQ